MPTGSRPHVFASGAQWLGTRLRAARRSREATRPPDQRAVCAARRGRRHARWTAGVRLSASRPRSRHERKPRRGTVRTRVGRGAGRRVARHRRGFVAKYVDAANVGQLRDLSRPAASSALGTTTPLDSLHVRFTNTNGGITGFAVQNLGNTNTSYSGMLFYDQNNAARPVPGLQQRHPRIPHQQHRRVTPAALQRVDQLHDSAARRSFIVAPNGNIGIGTTSPSALLEVSNAMPGGPANMWMTSYTNFVGPYYLARRARGTPGRANRRAEWRWPVRALRRGLRHDRIWSCLDRSRHGAGHAKLDRHGTGHLARVHHHGQQFEYPGDPDDARRVRDSSASGHRPRRQISRSATRCCPHRPFLAC